MYVFYRRGNNPAIVGLRVDAVFIPNIITDPFSWRMPAFVKDRQADGPKEDGARVFDESWKISREEAAVLLSQGCEERKLLPVEGARDEIQAAFTSLGFKIRISEESLDPTCQFAVYSFHREEQMKALVLLAKRAQRAKIYDIAHIVFCLLIRRCIAQRTLACKWERRVVTEDISGSFPDKARFDLLYLQFKFSLGEVEEAYSLSIPVPVLSTDIAFTLMKGATLVERQTWVEPQGDNVTRHEEKHLLWRELNTLVPWEEILRLQSYGYLAKPVQL